MSVTESAKVLQDNFEIGFRLFGQELVAFTLVSRSKARNWVVLSILSLTLLIAMVATYGPALKELVQ